VDVIAVHTRTDVVGRLISVIDESHAAQAAAHESEEIADMYAFVQSLPGGRSAKDIPILNDWGCCTECCKVCQRSFLCASYRSVGAIAFAGYEKSAD
jgi:hypothetical protein